MIKFSKYEYTSNTFLLITGVLFLGIMLRLLVSLIGYNYDFKSYLIVGDIVSHGKNVYVETTRYNYAFIFSWILGFFYWISMFFGQFQIFIYRYLIIVVLTLSDIGIFYFIFKNGNIKLAILFFLNPISIIITGYHNQFDNIAVLLSLIAIQNFEYTGNKFSYKDFLSIFFLSLSLVIKHILFLFPLWILFSNKLPLKKKLMYSIIPPIIFLFSFVPFFGNGGLEGILNNVFLYKSYNNSPLIMPFAVIFCNSIIKNSLFYIFFAFMILFGIIFRKQAIKNLLLFYFLCLVTFSSAVANQYLAIPLVAVILLGLGLKYIYSIAIGLYLVFSPDGLNIIQFTNINVGYMQIAGYTCAVWILLGIIILNLINVFKEKREKLNFIEQGNP